MFWHDFSHMVNSCVFNYKWQLWLITHKNYSKFCTRQCKEKNYMHCDFNDPSMIYIKSNVELLRIRNHKILVYNKVLDNRARLTHHPSTYEISWLHYGGNTEKNLFFLSNISIYLNWSFFLCINDFLIV